MFLSCVGVAGSARAQVSDDERARRHFESGESYFAEGDYESAAREFEQAFRLSQRPQLLYNLYVSQERLGHFGQAAEFLERYLAEHDAVEQRGLLEARLVNLRERAAHEAAGAAAAEPDVSSEPDTSAVAMRAPPEPAREVGGSGSGDDLMLGGGIALGVGGAGLVLLAVGGGLAAAENGRVADLCGASSTATCSDAQLSDLRSFALIADIGLGVAIGGVAAGVILVALGASAGESSDVAFAPLLSPQAAGLLARGSF